MSKDTNNIERRINRNCEIRAKADSRTITGYAAVFNSDSSDLGGFVESIVPGAFNRSLKENESITALVDHEFQSILARTDQGTLRLSEDDKGLRFEIDLPQTRYADDLLANIEHRNIQGMSFGFSPANTVDRWHNESGVVRRDLLDIDLIEVTATSIPAYEDTTVSIRIAQATRDKAASYLVDLDKAAEVAVEVEAEQEVSVDTEAEPTQPEITVEAQTETESVDLHQYKLDLLKVEIDSI